MSNQIESLKNLKKKKLFDLEEGTAAETMVKNNTVIQNTNPKKRLSVHISLNLEKEFKNLSKRLGITVGELLNKELKQFFENPEQTELINNYAEEKFANRSYLLDTEIKQKLDEYCSTVNRTKRFVVESVLGKLVDKHKYKEI